MQATDNDTISIGALSVRFLVEAADSNGSASVFECYVPANSVMAAPHSHEGFEETIYGLEATTTWTIDGETIDVGPGEVVCVQRGQIHGFQNQGEVGATFLAIATPGRFGPAYFREVGEVLAERRRSAGPGRDRRGDAPAWSRPCAAQRSLNRHYPLTEAWTERTRHATPDLDHKTRRHHRRRLPDVVSGPGAARA